MKTPTMIEPPADMGEEFRLATLPSEHYYDPAQYQLELERIWYRHWLYVCRSEALPVARAFRTVSVGNQNLLLVRDEQGRVQGHYNTCRHRGSVLSTAACGVLPSARIVCPYHRWSYALSGELLNVPMLDSFERLCEERPSLYSVHVREWEGCVFVNLCEGPPPPFERIMDPHIDTLKNWPLADLQIAHTHQAVLNCNWKVFWENFLECYHCPGIHPELCEMVPVYRTGVSTAGEAHTMPPYSGSFDPRATDGIRRGAETWSMDGQIHGVRFSGLSPEEIAVGYVFLMAWPTMYVVAHPDYVRLVSFQPFGPERVQLTAEWLFPAETLRNPDFDLRNVTAFATMVMEQDGRASELNQAGLRSRRHRQGMLVPQEQDIARFHQWVREALAAG